jgi:sulfonate transport system permease protein
VAEPSPGIRPRPSLWRQLDGTARLCFPLATTALLLLIAAEMIGANKGVGFQVMNAQYNFQIPLMFAAIFILAFLGLAANRVLVILQRRLCRWSIAQH